MLLELGVKDFAVIESLDIEFDAGMTVFTGETGAGKSIIVDALSLILGDRGDSSVVRHGQDKAEIHASFSVKDNPAAQQLLEAQEIEFDDEVLIRRLIHAEGRSRAFINGIPCPVQVLRKLGEKLVDIHGQHAHQSMLRKNMQRQLLDAYADHQPLLNKVNQHHQAWQTIQQQLAALDRHEEGRDAHLNLLKYQLAELAELQLQEGEVLELERDLKRLANTGQLMSTVESLLSDLTDSHATRALADQISHHQEAVANAFDKDDSLEALNRILTDMSVLAGELISECRHWLEQIEADPEQLARLDERLASLHDVARKHQIKAEHLIEREAELSAELADLEGGEERYQALQKELDNTHQLYLAAATELHKSRMLAAKKMSKAILKQLKLLGMDGSRFDIKLDFDDAHAPAADGLDSVEFQVSANPGQPLQARQ